MDHYYPADEIDVQRTSIHEAADLALSGQLTRDAPFYEALRSKALDGLKHIYATRTGWPEAARAREAALALGGSRRRFSENAPAVRIVSGGSPGLGKRA